MGNFDLQMTGFNEVQQLLQDSASLIVAKGLYQALDHAAGVIAGEVEARCPEAHLAGNANLREHVKVVVDVNLEKKGGTALVGFDSTQSDRTGVPMDAIALWVEYGHNMLGHRPDKKQLEPAVEPHPFMRPAFDASAERALEVFTNELIDGLADILPQEVS